MLRIDPLLNGRNIHARDNRKTMFSVVCPATVSRQRLGKQVPAATDTNAVIEERCFMWSVLRCYKQGTKLVDGSVHLSSARDAVNIGPERVKLKNPQIWKPLPGNG
jgi:hypothetical protein